MAMAITRRNARDSPDTDRQTLRDWVHRFNVDGLAGLTDLPRCNGPKPSLSPGQEAVVAEWVDQGFGVPGFWLFRFVAARNRAYSRARLRFFVQAEVPS